MRLARQLAALAGTAVLVVGAACSESPGGLAECSGCHTGPDVGETEFRGLEGVTDPTSPGVGAHTQHVIKSSVSAPFACEDCHAIPDAIASDDHFIAGGASVRLRNGFGAGGELEPAYDPDTRTCSQVYCHGASPLEGDDEASVTSAWDSTTGGGAECGTCHDVPPSSTRTGVPHPPSPACEACHPDAKEGQEVTDVSLHINGLIDVIKASN